MQITLFLFDNGEIRDTVNHFCIKKNVDKLSRMGAFNLFVNINFCKWTVFKVFAFTTQPSYAYKNFV